MSSPEPLLSVVAPIGLAASISAALLIDLTGDLRLASPRTLADLIGEGPRLDELSPGRTGVAMISAGGVGIPEAVEAVEMLSSRWPGVVIRAEPGQWPGPTVPVEALYPGLLERPAARTAVWQPIGSGQKAPGPGPVLPYLGRRLASQLLSSRLPLRSRWIRAWARVWELPWA